MEPQNRKTVVEGCIRLSVTHRPMGNTLIANDEDFKALKIEAKRVDPKRLVRYLKH
jgi:hypothetical protein